MMPKTKYRQIIHYSLIACTLLIQVAIVVFFYNEYFNGKKLTVIEQQLKETRVLKKLTDHSRKELLEAQENLQKYVNGGNQKKYLNLYFQSLRKLNSNIDSINSYEKINPSLKQTINSKKEEISKLTNLETLIDSVYQESRKPLAKQTPLKIENFDFKSGNIPEKFEVEVFHNTPDSTVKKGFFPRLKDAIKGEVAVKSPAGSRMGSAPKLRQTPPLTAACEAI